MGTMQSWLPAQGSGRGVLRALPLLVAVMIHTQFALGFEGSLTVLPYEPSSTLEAYVPPQDLDLRKTVLDFVDSEILLGRKAPQVQGPAKTPETTKVSPFRKWVKPKSSSTAKPQINTDKPQINTAKPKEITPAPLVASLPKTPPRTPLLLNPAKNPPLPESKRNTAVASDLPTRSDDEISEPENALPIPSVKKSAEPRLPSYHAPKAKTSPTPTPVKTAPVKTAPVKNLPPLTTSQINLRKKIRQVLTHYYNRPMNTRDRSPWELMHAMLAFEAHSKVLQGGPKGDPITAVGWLCYNQACKRRTLMYVGDEGDLRVRVGPALQGHRGQLLAMLAQSRINENYPLLVEGHKLKVADLIEMEMRTCYPRTELTFKLIALMHYLDSDESWVNDQGMVWGIPRLIAEEIKQPVRGAACGGTHRLSGLTLAYKTREKRGEPVDGQYLKAKKFVTRYQQYAYRLQNRDGSFSTEWFRGPGNEEDIDRKLKTTGHILEWLLYASSEQELKHWKTTKAANYLANIMQRNRFKDWEAGPLGHAIHALLVYDRLVFSPYDAPGQSTLALRSPTSRQTPSRQAPRQTSRRTKRKR